MVRGFTSRGQESGSVFSAAVCKVQAKKCCIKSLTLVLKKKEAASLKVKGLNIFLFKDRASSFYIGLFYPRIDILINLFSLVLSSTKATWPSFIGLLLLGLSISGSYVFLPFIFTHAHTLKGHVTQGWIPLLLRTQLLLPILQWPWAFLTLHQPK